MDVKERQRLRTPSLVFRITTITRLTTNRTTYDITMGCTSGNSFTSFQSSCDIYSFKLTYEFFFGTNECEKQCENSLCYDKTEMYSGWCEDFTTEILGVERYSSQLASFDCYSESWFFYVLVTMGFLLCCCLPCFCWRKCRKRSLR